MKTLLSSAAIIFLAATIAQGQIVIADNYDVTPAGTGFGLNAGVNAGINPPVTRLTGTAADGLRYLQTVTSKTPGNFSITSAGRVKVASSANSGRFTLSADGTTPFNFGSSLAGTPAQPSVYDVTISMANTLSGNQRFSFALGTAETDANNWDFGIQLYRAATADTFYQIGKRIDTASCGLAADVNASVLATAAGTYGNELNFRMRVFDAGAESTTYNSRVELYLDNALIYSTATDAALVNGFRFDGADRFFSWDQAGVGTTITGAVTYDDFSVTLVPEPSTVGLGLLAGVVLLFRRRR